MRRLFYQSKGRGKILEVSYTTGDLLRKFTVEKRVTIRMAMEKVATRAQEEAKDVSESLLLEYLKDEQNPLYASTGEHDVRFFKAGLNRRARLTCQSCKGSHTLTHQTYMNKAQWEEKKAEFLKQHPCAEVKNGETEE